MCMPAGRLTHCQRWQHGAHGAGTSAGAAFALHRAVIAPTERRAPLPRRTQFNPCACCPSAPLSQSREIK